MRVEAKNNLRSVWVALILTSLFAVGCDTITASRAMPTFIPPPTANPESSQTPAATGPSLISARTSSVARVTRGSIAQGIKARGRVVSVRQAFLYFPLKGVVNKLSVSSGDQVKKGDTIAELDSFELAQGVDQAQFELDKANIALRQAQAKLAGYSSKLEALNNVYVKTVGNAGQAFKDYNAIANIGLGDPNVKARYDRFQILEAERIRAEADLNTVKVDQQVAQLDIETAKSAIQLAQKKLDQAKARLDAGKIIAPFDGLILSIEKNVGEQVQAFEAIGAIADPNQLQLEASITDSDVGKAFVGQKANIVLDGFPEQVFDGKVKEIASQPTVFQGRSLYRVIVTYDTSSKVPATVRMGADISFILQNKDNVLLVPTNAVAVDGAKRYVTAMRDGKPQRVEVGVGIANESQTEIVSGLAEGDQVQVP